MACVGLISTPITSVKAADVSSSGSYVKVTLAPTDWSGDYLIVYEAGNLAFNGSLTTLDAVSNTISVTITDGVIVADDTTNAAKFTIEKYSTGYSIKSSSGKYISGTSGSNKLNSNVSAALNTIELETEGVKITSNTSVLRYNSTSGQYRFRYFKSTTYASQKAICLYKFVEATGGDETPETPEVDETLEAIKADLNEVTASMALAYTYKVTTQKAVVFALGANGAATHKDGSTAKTTYSETVDDYTLSITGGDKMYPSSYDAKGNSCIKLGTSSVAGKFSFIVPDDVESVIIEVANYKANTSKLTINGTSYTLTKNSDNGEYDKITVDTSTTKEVSVTTVSGGYRAMVNTITFVGDKDADMEPVTTFANSNFRIKCGVDVSLGDIANVTSCGICVTAGGKTVYYTEEQATSWTIDEEAGLIYVIISLGDIVNNINKLQTKFTVKAYVEYNETIYESMQWKEMSVVDLIKEYYDLGYGVGQLYSYLVDNGAIEGGV